MFANPTEIESIAGIGEPLSAATHLVGAGVVLFFSSRLIRMGAGNARRSIALAIFAFACFFQLVASGICHILMPGTTAHLILLRIDHAAIFFLIAATITPIQAILFRGPWRWGMLAFMWVAAISGIVLKTVFASEVPTWLSASLYLTFGWIAMISVFRLWYRHGYRFVALIIYGGFAYTFGVLVEAAMAMNGNIQLIPGYLGGHEIFHLAVLLGITLHWIFIRRIATGSLPSFAPQEEMPRGLLRPD